MPFSRTAPPLAAITLISLCLSAKAENPDHLPPTEARDWFEQDDPAPPPQVGAGELVFLRSPPAQRTLYSKNQLRVTASSLADGWVHIRQCYSGLDAVAKTDIVYRYNGMRDLRIDSYRNIRAAAVSGNSVQLSEVGADASLCIQTEAQILYPGIDGQLVLRNGPFQRRYLDGYFPMHVNLEVSFPARSLRLLATEPHQQPGFTVATRAGYLEIDSWFAGSLTIEMVFVPVAEP